MQCKILCLETATEGQSERHNPGFLFLLILLFFPSSSILPMYLTQKLCSASPVTFYSATHNRLHVMVLKTAK